MSFNSQDEIVTILIKKGKSLLKQPRQRILFTKNKEADDLLNNLEDYPHAYVLACIMDRQIKAEKAWLIPYKVSRKINGFEFTNLLKLNLNDIRNIFQINKLHRFNEHMAQNFYLAVQKIHNDYDDNASRIWNNSPNSAAMLRKKN